MDSKNLLDHIAGLARLGPYPPDQKDPLQKEFERILENKPASTKIAMNQLSSAFWCASATEILIEP